MQLASAPSTARVPAPATAAAPARPTVAPPDFTSRTLLPHELQVSRTGKGTVRSEVDRAIRFRIEGDGKPSERQLVADSKAAAELLTSPSGTKLDQALRSFLSVADGHVGNENLKSVTLIPDEHASKGVSVLNTLDSYTRRGGNVDKVIEPSPAKVDELHRKYPQYPKEAIREELRKSAAKQLTKQLTDGEAASVSFAGAWNGDGHIVMMPDMSRDMLATLGLYRIQPGDSLTKKPLAKRDDKARWSWHAAIHEAQHSISPRLARKAPESTRVMEESVAEVISPSLVPGVIAKAGADVTLAARPARDTKSEPVNWTAWNRDHLPKPPKDDAEKAKGRYDDGPTLVRKLLHLAGVDRRTTIGKATTMDLLQGEPAARVPRRLADAIVAAHELPTEQAPKLAELIRKAAVGKRTFGDIAEFVTGD